MNWINQFSKSASNFFKGRSLNVMQPIDFYHFYPMWYDLLITRISYALKALKADGKDFKDLQTLLPLPSSIRFTLAKIIPTYSVQLNKNKDDYYIVSTFLARMLAESCLDDPFSLNSNPIHSPQKVREIIKSVQWQEADIVTAKKMGRLTTATASFIHGVYNDATTDFGWDIYGPYTVKDKGKEYTLLIRHFANLQPTKLWPKSFHASANEIHVYSLYQKVDWKICFIGCHTIQKGETPISGLRKYAVYIDGKPATEKKIDTLINELSNKAVKVYKRIRSMGFEELKLFVMRQECYPFKKLFNQVNLNWEPTDEMIKRIKDKPLLKNIFPRNKMMKTTKEFEEIFGINIFKKEVLNKN
ncbi:MAG: hypothetical protein ABIJ91_03410 [Candidatus Kuenenbacteria bacterium]